MEDSFFFRRLESVKAGKTIADMHCKKDNSIFYFILNRHLGDAAATLSLLKGVRDYYGDLSNPYHEFHGKQLNIKKKKRIKKIVVMTTSSICGVAKLFSDYIDEIIVLKKLQLRSLERYALSSCSEHQNIIGDFGARAWIQFNPDTDEGTMVRWPMFGCNDFMWDLCLPKEYKFSVAPRISDETNSEAKKLMQLTDTSCQEIVILCPIAQSSSMLDESTWEAFANFCSSTGYKVFTNIHGPEKPINGTVGIDCTVDILAALAMCGVRIIGVQSGLMDVLAMLNPPHLTVCNVIKTQGDYFFYSLKTKGAEVVAKDVFKKGNILYIRIEHFEENYVVKLLMDNFR